jgi:hypothetical protein
LLQMHLHHNTTPQRVPSGLRTYIPAAASE